MSGLRTLGKVVRVARAEGLGSLMGRAIGASDRLSAALAEGLPLRAEHITHSSLVAPPPVPPQRPPGAPLTVGWVISPPSRGSGGHTTLFRFVSALEDAGHRCMLYVYDSRNDDVRPYEPVIRTWWPDVRAEVRSARARLEPADAFVATSWLTAHVLATAGDVAGRRFYLVQDYEPWFYARGAAQQLAEDTYRFGFEHITVGAMLAVELEKRFGVRSTVAEFGAALEDYRVERPGPRRGVVFFSRPGVARRGHDLGVLALEEFHRRRPEVPIHVFGSSARFPFPARVHGRLRPPQLNDLYNSCSAALALSFTNVSLVPHEMLAAGVVPVVNDFEGARAVLTNPEVVWALPTPGTLADALVRVVDTCGPGTPERVSASVGGAGWGSAEQSVVEALERACTR